MLFTSFPGSPSTSLCRARKKLDYAELCDDSEDDELLGTPPNHRNHEAGPPEAELIDRLPSPRERKRPKSAPNSSIQQRSPITATDSDRQAKVKQALILQMEMQKKLHDQLEVATPRQFGLVKSCL